MSEPEALDAIEIDPFAPHLAFADHVLGGAVRTWWDRCTWGKEDVLDTSLDSLVDLEALEDRGGEVARFATERLRKLHREVGRQIAVRGLARPLQDDVRVRPAEGFRHSPKRLPQLIRADAQESPPLFEPDDVSFGAAFSFGFAGVASFFAPSLSDAPSPARL